MRVAVFSDNFYPEIGGIQDSVEALGKTLAQRGHYVEFHVPHYTRGNFEHVGLPSTEIDLGENVGIRRLLSFPFPSSTEQSRVVFPSPATALRLTGHARPDIIHTQTFLGVGLRAVLAGRMLGIPIVGTNHTAIKAFGSYVPFGMDRLAAYVLWFYNCCDFVTAPSQSVFAELGIPKLQRPLQVLSNPIATDVFHPVSQASKWALKSELGSSGPLVTYAGRLGQEKNVEIILQALAIVGKQFPTVEFVIAGHGSRECVLRDLARELGIETNVRFLGTIPKSRLAKLFQASDVFVTMSTSETQSMAALQAMACGIPVIGANSRALPEYISCDRGALVPPSDVDALARHLITLLGRPDLRAELGRNGALFAQRFSTDKVVDEWELIYRRVIQERKHRQ